MTYTQWHIGLSQPWHFLVGELVHMPSKLWYITPLVQNLTFGYVKLFLQLIVKQSKTRTHGFTATIGCSDHSLCTVCSTSKYLSRRGITNTWAVKYLLFSLSNGLPITKKMFEQIFKNWLSPTHVNPDNYLSHSLRIGSATPTGQLGFNPMK